MSRTQTSRAEARAVATFKAIVIRKTDAGQNIGLEDFDAQDLMDGDVTRS